MSHAPGVTDGEFYYLCAACEYAVPDLNGGEPRCTRCGVGFMQREAGSLCLHCDKVFPTYFERLVHFWQEHATETTDADDEMPLAHEVAYQGLFLLATLLYHQASPEPDGLAQERYIILPAGPLLGACTYLEMCGLMALWRVPEGNHYRFTTAYYHEMFGNK